MSEPSDELVTEVEKALDAASLTLSRLSVLDATQVERVGSWIDRVTSQLRELTSPPGDTPRPV